MERSKAEITHTASKPSFSFFIVSVLIPGEAIVFAVLSDPECSPLGVFCGWLVFILKL